MKKQKDMVQFLEILENVKDQTLEMSMLLGMEHRQNVMENAEGGKEPVYHEEMSMIDEAWLNLYRAIKSLKSKL